MASKLEEALANKIGEGNTDDALFQAMSQLLILLLKRIQENFSNEIDKKGKDMIMNIYPRYSSLANKLIPSPS